MGKIQKTALIILDGFWINFDTLDENSIVQAQTPTFDKMFAAPYSELGASWEFVWLPDGQIWNSEVGHLTIGSWRILLQSLPKIEKLFSENEFKNIESFQNGISHVEKNNSTLHLFQLFGPGWVHAHGDQLLEMIKIIPSNISISLHLFLDGRDIAYNSALELSQELEKFLEAYKNVTISSVSWRYFAMDRDNNWERIEKVYSTITSENSQTDKSVTQYIEDSYDSEKYDEFVEPVLFEKGKTISENDAVFFLNYRSDRARQITQAFTDVNFDGFQREKIKNLYFSTMTNYYPEYSENVFVGTDTPKNVLAEVISNAWLQQMHLAETEKFAHVTKFFNWWKHEAYTGESWELCPSHKVATYDLDPAMSAYEIRDVFLEKSAENDFTVVNFANWDMVGHTGSLPAAIKAVETLDEVVLEIIAHAKENDIDLLITADHWNCEEMWTAESPKTAHTTLPVPCWYISNWKVCEIEEEGGLEDLAPTILANMGIEIPSEMTGVNLLGE